MPRKVVDLDVLGNCIEALPGEYPTPETKGHMTEQTISACFILEDKLKTVKKTCAHLFPLVICHFLVRVQFQRVLFPVGVVLRELLMVAYGFHYPEVVLHVIYEENSNSDHPACVVHT